MKLYQIFIVILFSLGGIALAQLTPYVQNIVQSDQNRVNQDEASISYYQNDLISAQAQLATDSASVSQYNALTNQYQASISQTASGVNWDYFVTLEPQIPFSTWSKVDSGINWSSIIPTLGINCGGITEASVNWSNWGNCESKGMTPGLPFGGKNTGIAAFWCGNGSISGTC